MGKYDYTPRYDTRCFFYDEVTGALLKPEHQGQPCKFLHPNDRGWDAGRSSGKKYNATHKRAFTPPHPRSPSPRPNRRRSTSITRQPTSEIERYPREDVRRPRTSSISSSTGLPSAEKRTMPSNMGPPPLPVAPPPMTSPAGISLPPPPVMPAFTNVILTPPSTVEVKVKWDEILPLLADAVSLRSAQQEAIAEFEEFDRMYKAFKTKANTSIVETTKWDLRRAALQATKEARSQEVIAGISKLKNTNWWPVGPNEKDGTVEKYDQIVVYAKSLCEMASRMYGLYEKRSSPPEDEQARGLDGSRPLKRRRISDAADVPATVEQADMADLEQLREKLAQLESQATNIDNAIVASGESMAETAVNYIEEISLEAWSAEVNRVPMEALKVTNTDVNAVTAELVDLLAQAEAMQGRIDALEAERQQDLAYVDELKARLDAYEEISKRDGEAMSALAMAFEAFKARPPPTPSLPLGFILEAVDQPIRNAVTNTVRPMVEDMAQKVGDDVEKREKETVGQIWGKMALILKFVETVSKVTSEAVENGETTQDKGKARDLGVQ